MIFHGTSFGLGFLAGFFGGGASWPERFLLPPERCLGRYRGVWSRPVHKWQRKVGKPWVLPICLHVHSVQAVLQVP